MEISASPESNVLVIGGSGLDIVGRLRTEPCTGTSNPAQIRTSFGGVARNVAENLARLGQSVQLLTIVGDDQAGRRLLEHAASNGIDITPTLVTPEFSTGSYLAVLNADGKLHLALDDMRVMAALQPAQIRERAELVSGASLVFVDANVPPAALRTVVSLASKARVPICADPASLGLAPRLGPHLDKLYMITPNGAEAAILCRRNCAAEDPESGLQIARDLVGQGVKIVILPIAEYGVCYATSETSGHIPAIQTAIVDPTGAGDALTATVLFALLNDIPLDEAVRLGVSAASLTLRYPGTVNSELSLEKLYGNLLI